MKTRILDLKKEIEIKFSDIRIKRKKLLLSFKKKLEEEKIKKIKNSILKN